MSTSPKQSSVSKGAFEDALLRAKEIAARLSKQIGSSDVQKRPLEGESEGQPDFKKPASNEVITPQLAALKAQQVADRINQQLGINRSSGDGITTSAIVDLSKHAPDPHAELGSTSFLSRQTEAIKRLSEQYDVRITSIDDGEPVGNRPVRISGDSDNVLRAKEAIELLAGSSGKPEPLPGVFGEYGNRRSEGAVSESAFNVPVEKAGIVIGKGGESIKDINRRSGAFVEIDRTQKPGGPGQFRVFNIRGTPDQIMRAQHMIYDKCANSPGGAPTMTPPPGHPALNHPSQQEHQSSSYGNEHSQASAYGALHHRMPAPAPRMDYGGAMSSAAGYPPFHRHQPPHQPMTPGHLGPMHQGMNRWPQMPLDQYGGLPDHHGMWHHHQQQGPHMHPPMHGMDRGKNTEWQHMMYPNYYQQQQPHGQQGYAPPPSSNPYMAGQQPPQDINQPHMPMPQNPTAMPGAPTPIQQQQQQQQQQAPQQQSMAQPQYQSPTSAASSQPLQGAASTTPATSAAPATNMQTGQPDYSLAWAEYYRSLGHHAQADAILRQASQNQMLTTGTTAPTVATSVSSTGYSAGSGEPEPTAAAGMMQQAARQAGQWPANEYQQQQTNDNAYQQQQQQQYPSWPHQQ